jgi:hypothetical protein
MTETLYLSAAPAAQAVNLMVLGRDQGGVDVQYTTFDTNKPKTYGNTLYVWEASGPIIPWGQPVKASTVIDQDQYLSTQRLAFDYQVSLGYIIGYGVAPDPNAICASVFIPPDNAEQESPHLTISLQSFANQYVKIQYMALDNYNPAANKNWIGLWNGPRAGYDGDPQAKADVKFANSRGSVAIMGANILIGATYTIGYFMAALTPGKTALAAQTTFNT